MGGIAKWGLHGAAPGDEWEVSRQAATSSTSLSVGRKTACVRARGWSTHLIIVLGNSVFLISRPTSFMKHLYISTESKTLLNCNITSFSPQTSQPERNPQWVSLWTTIHMCNSSAVQKPGRPPPAEMCFQDSSAATVLQLIHNPKALEAPSS